MLLYKNEMSILLIYAAMHSLSFHPVSK